MDAQERERVLSDLTAGITIASLAGAALLVLLVMLVIRSAVLHPATGTVTWQSTRKAQFAACNETRADEKPYTH